MFTIWLYIFIIIEWVKSSVKTSTSSDWPLRFLFQTFIYSFNSVYSIFYTQRKSFTSDVINYSYSEKRMEYRL